MEPAFRDNFGGDPVEVRALLSKYSMRSLWLDPQTSRRIDHVRAAPGYRDLSEAYHDSVEEAYFLGGVATLSAEGEFQAGDYFWRPPGWVHKAWSEAGFENILCMEGAVPSEGSGRVSRVICGDHEAGQQARDDADAGIGPRGYVRHRETRFEPWRTHLDGETGLEAEPSGRLRSKVLSVNVDTGAASVLVDIPVGWESVVPACSRERFLITTSGAPVVDGAALTECSVVHIPAGEPGPMITCPGAATILVKVCEVSE